MRFPKQFVLSGALARARDLTGSDIRVLLALIVIADDAGAVTASQKDLGDLTGLGRRSLRRVLDSLEEKGLHHAETGQGRAGTYRLNLARLGAKNLAPAREKLPEINMAPERAKFTRNMAPERAKFVETPTRVLNSPTGTNHQNEPFARNALTTLRTDRHLPLSIDELLHHAYRLGGGDPWTGYLEIKIRTEASFTGARDLTAVIRKRLEDAA